MLKGDKDVIVMIAIKTVREMDSITTPSSSVELSDEFRQETIKAAQSRLGQPFLNDAWRPEAWSRLTPFDYGLDPSTGGVNCSGLVISSIADVLGRAPQKTWRAQYRTSRSMVDLIGSSADYTTGQTDFSKADISDLIVTVSEHIDSKGRWRQVGRHVMIVQGRLEANTSRLPVVHAELEDGVVEHIISGQTSRVRVPLEVLVNHCVVGSDKETF